MPKISVIMGVYNCKDINLLNESVNSIINQSYTDWEFIICNDGSTDNTLDILNDIKKRDERIRIISYEKNKGLRYALNKCIEISEGEYIARQDDDDISDCNRLEKQLDYLENNVDISVVGCTAIVFDGINEWGKYKVPENPQNTDFYWNSPFIHPSVIMRKQDLIKAGCYRISKETRRCEDYDLFMRMYSLGMKGHNIQENLYKYKVTNGNKKYRPMKYRIDEAKVRFIGYKSMGILIKGIPYIIKPIIIGLIPQCIFKKITEKQYK